MKCSAPFCGRDGPWLRILMVPLVGQPQASAPVVHALDGQFCAYHAGRPPDVEHDLTGAQRDLAVATCGNVDFGRAWIKQAAVAAERQSVTRLMPDDPLPVAPSAGLPR